MSGLDHIPDVRDGLSEVERRVLHRLSAPGAERRRSRVVADEARRGTDLSRGEVYGVLARLTQSWVMRYPLVNGDGNFGSPHDDPPTSPEYTWARLRRRATGLFGASDPRPAPDAKGPTIDFATPLSGPFPNLLANGSTGGLAEFPPHPMPEIAAAVALRLSKPSSTLDEILAVMPGPDYPSGGELVDLAEARAAYETGRGALRLRAAVHVEEDDDAAHALAVAKAKADPHRLHIVFGLDQADHSPEEWERLTFIAPARRRVVVTGLPFGVSESGEDGLMNRVVGALFEKRLAGIGDIRSETDRTGMRMAFEIDAAADPHVVLEQMMQADVGLVASIPVLLVALVDGRPQQLTLLELIDGYIDHQRSVRLGSRAEVDTAIAADLATLVKKKIGQRRTRLPASN